MSRDRREPHRHLDVNREWDYRENRDPETDYPMDRDFYGDREHHRSRGGGERGHRGVNREREHHVVVETDRERNAHHEEHREEECSGHEERHEGSRRRGARVEIEHRTHHERRSRSRVEVDSQELEREPELRRRGSRDFHEPSGHRLRHLSHDKPGPSMIATIHEIKEELPLPPTPCRKQPSPTPPRKQPSPTPPRKQPSPTPPRKQPSPTPPRKQPSPSPPRKPPSPTPSRKPPSPVPLDFPVDRPHSEYGPHELDDQDPRLRAELYPLESNMSKVKHKCDEPSVGSHMNLISAETFGHTSRSRHVDVHYHQVSRERDSDSHGMRKFSSRSTPYIQSHSTEGGFHESKSKEDEVRKCESLRRRMSGHESRTSARKLPNYTILKEDEESIERHASVLLPVLEDSEKIFHELVAAGDVEATRAFLCDHPDFNINCVNYHKISALHVAVKEQNEAMVEFLLEQKDLDISDCALYAIKGGSIRIVEMILDKIRERSPRLEFAGTTHSVDFSDDLTPIVLAAQLGNYEMIDFLIKRGHSIPPVHPPFCKCDACKADLKKYDRLRYSTMKLNLYKAISNPMYIFHTTDDPFQRAFELVKELQDAATVFPQFKVSFEALWQSLRVFTTELIGCCRNAQEVEIVLKKSPKSVADHVKFPRLQYAIDLKQKEFVSHPYTQAVLGDAWTGELLEWKIRSPLMQSLSVLPRIPMLPIMTIMCIILPNHSLVRKWKTPVNKMISSVASYLIFLIILFLESNLDKTNQKRGPPNSGLEGVIIIYVIGYIWLNIRTCFKQGIKRFFSTMWHWYDTIMLFMFSMTIIFWIASWVDITANDDIDLPRKYWNALDPELIAEGFFASAVIMAFFRLNLFLSLNYHLGPLQVSIGKMTLDIFRFIIIFFIIILAWCAGLCRFYQPYEGMVQKDAASGNTTTQVSSFVNFLMTLKTFFWAIFGMSPIESADVIIENLPGDTPGTTIINKHQFTEAVGYIAFALFQFLSVVVVLNMLVACMSNTFTKVIDNVTVEWVFGRSQIYLSFMASSILPPPFNLVPTASGIKDMFRWFRLLAKPSDGQRARCSLSHCCYIESETEAFVNNEFPSLMSELAQRYIRLKSDVKEEESNDLDEIKNEINELKEMLRRMMTASYCRRI